jgi:transcriptional regulator with XRE-family HTH domain
MNMNMEKRLHGYLVLPRQSKLLRQELGYDLFGFYLMLAMEAVWHRGNKRFGQVVGTQAELAKILHMDQSTVSRNLGKLEKHKYCVIRHEQKYITLGFFPLFLNDVSSKIYSKNYASLNELYADMHRINAELQEDYANMQDRRTQKAAQSSYGSSNEYVSSAGVNGEVDIDDIYEGIERMKRERKSNY